MAPVVSIWTSILLCNILLLSLTIQEKNRWKIYELSLKNTDSFIRVRRDETEYPLHVFLPDEVIAPQGLLISLPETARRKFIDHSWNQLHLSDSAFLEPTASLRLLLTDS